jgi:pimeloyl-ACP methyl ester carboxylesterase
MDDGVTLSTATYLPDGAAPAAGWPGVVVLHGLAGTKESVGSVAEFLRGRGYAVLVYDARGHGASGGNVELASAREVADLRALELAFAGRTDVSDRIGCWGISYGGGQCWNAVAAGVPFRAAEVVETWTDLYSALWPGNVAKSGIVLGFAKSVEKRSPLIAELEDDAVHSTGLANVKALVDQRSSLARLGAVRTPVYLFQGRRDYAFDIDQAARAFARLAGPKKLYVGQFGHAPSAFPGPDVAYVLTQGGLWFDRWLKGTPNGIDRAPRVTLAAATGTRRASSNGLPATTVVGAGFRGTGLSRTTGRLAARLETFGPSVLTVQVPRVAGYPRLVATLTALEPGGRQVTVTHGGVVPRPGLNTIRLASYAVAIPKGSRLRLDLGPDSASHGDIAYFGFGDVGTISVGAASLKLSVLRVPVS